MVNKYTIIIRAGNVIDFRLASPAKDDDKDASIQYNQAPTFKPVLKLDETQFLTGDAGTFNERATREAFCDISKSYNLDLYEIYSILCHLYFTVKQLKTI